MLFVSNFGVNLVTQVVTRPLLTEHSESSDEDKETRFRKILGFRSFIFGIFTANLNVFISKPILVN